ncbi:MAG TPA: IPT/TIG domain-containing protein [Polyangia bacterium]|nr:IPT/TIG domain-containing protein [Polyangia bacterium]
MRMVGTAALGLLLAAAACSGTDEPTATLTSLTPARAYTDTAVPAALRGGPFRPSFAVDTSSGSARIDLTAFACLLLPTAADDVTAASTAEVTAWTDPMQLDVSVPAKLPAGFYDVLLREPNGPAATLKKGFQSLGPDTDAPEVSLDAPLGGTFVVAGTRVPVTVSANDGDGHLISLGWTLTSLHFSAQTHTCPAPAGASHITCDDGALVLPESTSLQDQMILRVDAQDDAGNLGSREDLLWLAQAPVLTSFAPAVGPSTGMTQIVVRGQAFVMATRVLIDGVPINPAGGIWENDTTMRGFTNAHDPGAAPVVLETGNQQVVGQAFTFVAVPVIRQITPNQGPSAGGTVVTIVGSHFVCDRPDAMGTQFSVGAGVVRVPLTVTDCAGMNRVAAIMPGYMVPPDGTGTVSLFALDAAAGESELPDAFTYASLPVTPPPMPIPMR